MVTVKLHPMQTHDLVNDAYQCAEDAMWLAHTLIGCVYLCWCVRYMLRLPSCQAVKGWQIKFPSIRGH